MSRDLNRVQMIGRLGADPEMRYTPSGAAVTNFRLAVNRRRRGGDDADSRAGGGEGGGQREEGTTDWFTVVAWERLAEICSQYLRKGSKVYVEGRLQVRQYETQQGEKRTVTDLVANDMIMLDTRRTDRPEGEESFSRGGGGGSGSGGDSGSGGEDDIEDIPF